ncbi:MAG: putative rane protein [Verrucomicrobiota bacterium]|jgi:putative membrane protein
MKNKLTIISRFGIAGALLGVLSFAGVAKAQMYGSGSKSGGTIKTEATPEGEREWPGARTSDKAPLATSPTAARLSAADKTFMMNAAKGGMMEVEWGKWAAQNGQNADVKKFGNKMVTDHSRANNELMALAAKKGVKLKSEKVTGKWTSDKAYMDMMVQDHQKDLAEFQGEAKNGTDPDVKKWAGDTSKMIQQHLKMAQQTDSKLK